MYITRVEIENIKCFKRLVWEIDAGEAPGWHVILGDNGSGKSSFIGSAAMALMGVPGTRVVQPYWERWFPKQRTIKHGESYINPSVRITGTADNRYDENSNQRFNVTVNWEYVGFSDSLNTSGSSSGNYPDDYRLQNKGWFSTSFGPYRRFTGGDSELEKSFLNYPKIYRHITTFVEGVALSESLAWLQQLRFQALESNVQSGVFLTSIIDFINLSGLLPKHTFFESVRSDGIYFILPNGEMNVVTTLSDGFRATLSLIFELIRQLHLAFGTDIFERFGTDKIVIKVPGIVLIDEVDAHLHPTWQQRIGFWFREHFPNIQFIVTTHSPFICQAASKGTIFQLPQPGTDEGGRFVTDIERGRLLYGDILDAYSTEVFGAGLTRSAESMRYLDELADLNIKQVFQGLTDSERERQEYLRSFLPTAGSTLPESLAR